ncbi:unnamed protein product [Dibothriocephalus latus]|uniref:Pre-rRNA-processing protein TSR2 homolog n=1 Tax=Dibothriocephalus latus TaxID=60516 RepID=A0A3P7NTS1_DIBLA|nr:unnamed protein product [Dibothriocephalus latus]
MTALPDFISKVLQSWTVLRLAQSTSTAGPNTSKEIDGLLPFIMQRLHKRILEEDLAEWLEDYLCSRLNVLCEDDSQFDVSKLIVEGYSLSAAGKLQELAALADTIPSGCDLQQCAMQEVNCEVPADEVDDEDDDTDASDDEAGDLVSEEDSEMDIGQ